MRPEGRVFYVFLHEYISCKKLNFVVLLILCVLDNITSVRDVSSKYIRNHGGDVLGGNFNDGICRDVHSGWEPCFRVCDGDARHLRGDVRSKTRRRGCEALLIH